jgi:hypothetical protein
LGLQHLRIAHGREALGLHNRQLVFQLKQLFFGLCQRGAQDSHLIGFLKEGLGMFFGHHHHRPVFGVEQQQVGIEGGFGSCHRPWVVLVVLVPSTAVSVVMTVLWGDAREDQLWSGTTRSFCPLLLVTLAVLPDVSV